MIKNLIEKNRTYRRFYQNQPVEMDTLRELIDLARLSSSGANLQALKFVLANTPQKNETIFQTLLWAQYLKGWDGPEEGEKPAAYIVIVTDLKTDNLSISRYRSYDVGIAAQSILLGACEKGLGGCMFGNIKRIPLKKVLGLGDRYEISLVIALGKPKETVKIEPLGPEGDIRYWRDENGVHHVPKRALDDLILTF